MARFIDSDYFTRLFELAQGLGGGFFLVVVGVEFEGCIELSDSLILLVEALSHLGEEEMSFGIVGDGLDGVFEAQIGGVEVALVAVEACYLQIFFEAFVVGLGLLDLGELAPGVDTVAAGIIEGRIIGVGGLVGIGRVGAGLVRIGRRRGG